MYINNVRLKAFTAIESNLKENNLQEFYLFCSNFSKHDQVTHRVCIINSAISYTI